MLLYRVVYSLLNKTFATDTKEEFLIAANDIGDVMSYLKVEFDKDPDVNITKIEISPSTETLVILNQ